MVEFSIPAGDVATLLEVGASLTDTTLTEDTIAGFAVSVPRPLSLIWVIVKTRFPAVGASLSVFW